jgi:hypothetical protein
VAGGVEAISAQSDFRHRERHVSLPGTAFSLPTVQNDPIHVHCDYLELLAEYGIIGWFWAPFSYRLTLRSGFKGVGEIVRTKLEPAWETSSNEAALAIGALSAIIASAWPFRGGF